MLGYVILDDHPAVRSGIGAMLVDVAERLGEAGDIEEFASLLPLSREPDVAIVDLGLPNTCRRHVLSRVRQLLADVPILVITGAHDWPDAVLAFQEGARGYLRKSVEADVLTEAMSVVASGGTHLTRQLEADIADTPELNLSDRQREILRCAARGWTNDEIRRETGLALGTIENLITGIRRELPQRLERLAAGSRGLTVVAQSLDPGCEYCREQGA